MKHDMTEGSISRHLVRFAIPLILGNMFQLTYNAVDSIVVGRFVGNEAQAAIGICNPFMNVLSFFIVGVCNGIAVLMSEFCGAKDEKALREEMGTSLIFGTGFFAVLALVVWCLVGSILHLLSTPLEVFEMTGGYLRIVLVGLVFTYIYNLYASALRSMGDAKTPLYFLIFSSVLNIVLDLWFVAGLKMQVYGAAIATVISQTVSSVMCVVYVYQKVPVLKLTREECRIARPLLGKTIHYSWATGMQKITLNVGKLLVQAFINPLGVDVIAAFNAVNRIDDFVFQPEQSIGAAMTTFAAQNRGAKKNERIQRSFRIGMCMEIAYWAVIGTVVFLNSKTLMTWFSPEPDNIMIDLGVSYLSIMAFLYLMPGITNGLQGYVRGWGQMNVCLISTFVQIVARVATAAILIPRFGMKGAAYCCFFGWMVMLLYEVPYYIIHRKTKFSL